MSAQSTSIFIHYSLLVVIIIFITLSTSAFLPLSKRKKIIYLILALGTLAMMTMFRGPTVGNDTQGYISYFNAIARADSFWECVDAYALEPGYIIWNWCISRVWQEPQSLFIITGFFVYFSIGRFLYKWVLSPGIVVYLIVTMHFFDGYLSTMRQTIALAILLFSYDSVINKKPLHFVFLNLVAVQFHFSAILYIIMYPVVNLEFATLKRYSSSILTALVVGSVIFFTLFFDRIFAIVLSLFPKYQYYLGGATVDGETRIATILNIVVYSLMIIVPLLFKKNSISRNQTNEYRHSDAFHSIAILNLAVLFITINAVILTRFSGLFSVFSICDYSYALTRMNKRDYAILVILTMLLFYVYGLVIALLRTPEWYSTYPYSFFWM